MADERWQMKDVFVASDNIITSLGFTTDENIVSISAGKTGIKRWEDNRLAPLPFWASNVDSKKLHDRFSNYANPEKYTRFEQLTICSIEDALQDTLVDLKDKRTLFILSTTKGNIDLLDRRVNQQYEPERVYLWHTARLLQQFFHLQNKPVVVSNACISGVMAIIIGARLIRSGHYNNIIITGADLVTEFVLSGFNSFLSLSDGPCRPFDKHRQGLSLGEGAGTVILTSDPLLVEEKSSIMVGHGFSSNDANHISGPSRTGEGLYIAIKKTLEKTDCTIDYISAHGTATPYNDEMESIALTSVGLQQVPVNSLKGYWGHTLGAAGVIESVAGIHSLKENVLFNTLGFSESGVTHPIAIINKTAKKELGSCLKIASGFGGCNAALLFYK
jgi:3-oxoacyl-[acyl-carrier-protein] synthase-1